MRPHPQAPSPNPGRGGAGPGDEGIRDDGTGGLGDEGYHVSPSPRFPDSPRPGLGEGLG